MADRGRGRSRRESIATAELPREIIEACCTNSLSVVKAWLGEAGTNVDACTGLPDLKVGTDVEAIFHGGEEWYSATVAAGPAPADGSYSLEYKEHGLVWGEYECCPRDQIKLAGSTASGQHVHVALMHSPSPGVSLWLPLYVFFASAPTTGPDPYSRLFCL